MICVAQTRSRPGTVFAILASMVKFQMVQDTIAFNNKPTAATVTVATSLVQAITFTFVPNAIFAQPVLSQTL